MKSKNSVLIIGAGNIGSRHLQGLKKVSTPLSIQIIDPSETSLNLAKERYEQTITDTKHEITFSSDINQVLKDIDLAIIATSADVRKEVTEKLLAISDVKFIIFEKLLFEKKEDYIEVEKLLQQKNITAWVNCCMRITPFYANLKNKIEDKKVNCIVNGSSYGFITNAIHFIDYIAYLSDNYDFTLDTSLLDKKPIESKRKGFLELNGTLNVSFKNGSMGTFVCYENGEAPVMVEILNRDFRAMANETDRTTYIANPPSWKWAEVNQSLLFQSDMTNIVVQNILENGKCELTTYEYSSKLHLNLLEGLKDFLNQNSSKKYDYYPFT